MLDGRIYNYPKPGAQEVRPVCFGLQLPGHCHVGTTLCLQVLSPKLAMVAELSPQVGSQAEADAALAAAQQAAQQIMGALFSPFCGSAAAALGSSHCWPKRGWRRSLFLQQPVQGVSSAGRGVASNR